ncbi:serine hydrolase domain-containing protein [Mesonia sp.]|uniref:serine hydrolase domain-containing protein n=1 Tax=Mesonia sp. TaxID=1960830 RepID=UPI0017557287|nr:serine hydrolase domain-containing protein [Mesonia sp.]HIB37418.1 class A beta-lactamase-related serine hydrolase [Mesonia sp.]HIO26739.1 class A beta-lactamase-related serine hydrolase [Flavobacteriaceae bacterium]
MKKNKIWFVRVLLLTATVISLYFVPWKILFTWLQPLPETIQEQVDSAIDYGFDGIIVCIDKDDENLEFYTAGYHNRAQKIPAKPDALFKIASVGKLYHAVAITKLVSDKKLSLDQSLAHYFPELADHIENAEKITLRMLVQHRSGIPNFTDVPNFWVNPPKTKEETLELVLDQPANFLPGEDYEYSNTNYLLLGELIEKTTGEDKFQFIQKEILKPLQLKNTYGSLAQIDMDRLMSGYYVGIEEDIKTDDNGFMIATAEDVAKFIRALNEGTVFENDEAEIYANLYKYNHTGLIPGYQTIAEYHKDLDAVVIQFTNTTNFNGYEWNLSEINYSRIIKILERAQNP